MATIISVTSTYTVFVLIKKPKARFNGKQENKQETKATKATCQRLQHKHGKIIKELQGHYQVV